MSIKNTRRYETYTCVYMCEHACVCMQMTVHISMVARGGNCSPLKPFFLSVKPTSRVGNLNIEKTETHLSIKLIVHQQTTELKGEYLGVILDTKFNWKPAIHDRIRKLELLLIDRESPLSTKHKILLYKILTYGTQAWCPAAKTHTQNVQQTRNTKYS